MARPDRIATRISRDDDVATIRDVVAAAFDQPDEADLVDALRDDPQAWVPELSAVATDEDGEIVGFALLTRCRVGGAPALVLAPCGVPPDRQNRGVGSAVTSFVLNRARGLDADRRGTNLVVVLGHPEYYPRFGFRRASSAGISVAFEVPDDALMYLPLDPALPVPSGVIEYPPGFGV